MRLCELSQYVRTSKREWTKLCNDFRNRCGSVMKLRSHRSVILGNEFPKGRRQWDFCGEQTKRSVRPEYLPSSPVSFSSSSNFQPDTYKEKEKSFAFHITFARNDFVVGMHHIKTNTYDCIFRDSVSFQQWRPFEDRNIRQRVSCLIFFVHHKSRLFRKHVLTTTRSVGYCLVESGLLWSDDVWCRVVGITSESIDREEVLNTKFGQIAGKFLSGRLLCTTSGKSD